MAYFVVQWEASIPVRLLAVTMGTLAINISLCELIKRAGFLRILFGMKHRQTAEVHVAVT